MCAWEESSQLLSQCTRLAPDALLNSHATPPWTLLPAEGELADGAEADFTVALQRGSKFSGLSTGAAVFLSSRC